MNCKYTKIRGVFCKNGHWLTDDGNEFHYKTLLSANLANSRLFESKHNGKLRLNSFLSNANRCQLYEEDQEGIA